jgi:glycosyltransferase involved in cell wall biosynthesis
VKPNRAIAIFVPCLLTGGTDVATLETAKAFIALGYGATTLVYFDEVDPAMQNTFQGAGIAVHRLGLVRGGALRLGWRVARALRGRRYDLIWVQYMTPTLVPLLVARFFSRRLVAAVHVAASHYTASGLRRLRWLARWWCARFVCVSQTVALGIFGERGDCGVPAGRIAVIPNALNATEADGAHAYNWRQRFGLADDCILIGFVGRLVRAKGADILLRALALIDHDAWRLRVVLVGEGEEHHALEALVQELDLGDTVLFAGRMPCEQIFSAMKGFDVVVMPSRSEGFGLSALEAMACGLPLVASRVDALPEVVLEGETGLLFEPENPADLARKLTDVLEDTQLRKRLGQAAIAHVRRLYDRPAYQVRVAELVGGMN